MLNGFSGKRVLVTGHTGFKGSWLTVWLKSLGAEVAGLSNGVPTKPSLFEDLGLEADIQNYSMDVRDSVAVSEAINEFKPEFLFHLAAQSIVSVSYQAPVDTIATNAMGTANILNALRGLDSKCVAVFITSDKCYENIEQQAGYRESDRLGGKDIYSASKSAAENIFHAFQLSYFDESSNIRLATARAGNVIGGGDWAVDRIVVDYMHCWRDNTGLQLRNSLATRPWQHVLEPLSGYLVLATYLEAGNFQGESFNFGPEASQPRSVAELIGKLDQYMGRPVETIELQRSEFSEAGLLQLDCEKAVNLLDWQSTLTFDETSKFVAEYYLRHFSDPNQKDFMLNQIEAYTSLAKSRARSWATGA